jgi:hypothetical protein
MPLFSADTGLHWQSLCLLLLLHQVDVSRFMSDGQRLAELIQAVKLQHKQQLLQELLEEDD